MNRRLIVAVLGLMMTCASGIAAPVSGGEEQAVKDAAASFYAALQAMFIGDAAPMKKVWSHADDVSYMGPDGKLKRGWPAIRGEWEAQAALKLGGEVQPLDLQVTVGQDLAVTTCWEKGQNVGPDGKVEAVSIRATNVFRKERDGWKMIGHHTDLLPFLAK